MKKLSLIYLTACAVLLALLGGCATPTRRLDVGAVVVAPVAKLPAVPVIVQATPPKPVGYFQGRLLSYSSSSPETQTTSTPPTPAAGSMPTQ